MAWNMELCGSWEGGSIGNTIGGGGGLTEKKNQSMKLINSISRGMRGGFKSKKLLWGKQGFNTGNGK